MMCMTLAGRAAEETFFGKVTTGATDDLNKVTKIAYGITQIYGMGSAIGNQRCLCFFFPVFMFRKKGFASNTVCLPMEKKAKREEKGDFCFFEVIAKKNKKI